MSEKPLAQAEWITFNGAEAPMVRKSFECCNVKKAVIEICGLGNFYLFINGKNVSDDLFVPAQTNYEPRNTSDFLYPIHDTMSCRIYYMEYDITNLVFQGKNIMSVLIGNGWYNQADRDIEGKMSFGDPKLIYRIKLTDSSDNTSYILSDTTTKWENSFILKNNLFFGETQDLNLFDSSWNTLDYDDGNWNFALKAQPTSSPLQKQTFPADKLIRTTEPKIIYEDETRKIYDVGENVSGWVQIKLLGNKNETVSVVYSDKITDDNRLLSDDDKEQFQKDVFICDGSEKTVHPFFVFHAFRYCEITGNAHAVICDVIHTPLETTASFKSDNKFLNWLYDVYIRTQTDNVHMSVPLDCPHRERLGYTGDGQITASSAMSVFDGREFYKKWIKDIIDCQDIKSGHIQHSAPFNGGGGGPGGWGCAIVTVPYMYYKNYGDASVLKETYTAMEKWVSYMISKSENNLVVSEEEGGWCLGDWGSAIREELPPEPFVNTYYLVKSLMRMKEICYVLNIPFTYESVINDCKEAIFNTYFDKKNHCFCNSNQGADAFAIDIGLGDEEVLQNMVCHYETLGYLDTGIFGTEVLLRVLFETNHADTALKLLTSTKGGIYSDMHKENATTLWEHCFGYGSHNHPMFGSYTAMLFENLAGIKLTCSGEIFIHPCKQTIIKEFEISRQTPKGKITVIYKNNSFEIHAPSEIKEYTYDGKTYQI